LNSGSDPEFGRSLQPEEINALPIRRYEGEVRLLEAPQDLERAIGELREERVVGFDTETRPAFRAGESYLPSLAQVASSRAVYLFPLTRHDCSHALRELLSSAHVAKAGVGLADDLKSLKKSFEFHERAIVDLGAIAKRRGVAKTGVRALAALLLGIRIPKGAKTSNWAARRLSPQQIAYAATDAWVCRELYLRFEELGFI